LLVGQMLILAAQNKRVPQIRQERSENCVAAQALAGFNRDRWELTAMGSVERPKEQSRWQTCTIGTY